MSTKSVRVQSLRFRVEIGIGPLSNSLSLFLPLQSGDHGRSLFSSPIRFLPQSPSANHAVTVKLSFRMKSLQPSSTPFSSCSSEQGPVQAQQKPTPHHIQISIFCSSLHRQCLDSIRGVFYTTMISSPPLIPYHHHCSPKTLLIELSSLWSITYCKLF